MDNNIIEEDNDKLKDKNCSEYSKDIINCQFYWCGSCCVSFFLLPYIIYINTKKY